jgi:hypothetical protein
VAGLLQEGHGDHGGGVTLGTGIAVPVPGTAEVAALLDDANIGDAGLDEAGAEKFKAALGARANELRGKSDEAKSTCAAKSLGLGQ